MQTPWEVRSFDLQSYDAEVRVSCPVRYGFITPLHDCLGLLRDALRNVRPGLLLRPRCRNTRDTRSAGGAGANADAATGRQ